MEIIQWLAYPTREEILEGEETVFPPEILGGMKSFKKLWRMAAGDEAMRLNLLKSMLGGLNEQMHGEEVNIERGECYYYQPTTKTIRIPEKLSIISCLHELGHHLKGASELEACRFSVHLFKQCFPKAFAKLRWDGHMLVKSQ